MEAEIPSTRRWSARIFPERSAGYFIGGYIAHYADELMRDMGLEPRRLGLVREYLEPLWTQRYRTIADERRSARNHVAP